MDFSSFDLVITQCRYYLFTGYMVFTARRKGMPVLHIEHNAGYMLHKNPLITLIARLYDVFIGRKVLSKATSIVAISESVKKFLKENFKITGAIEVIPGGIQTKEWVGSESLSDTKTFVYCGRLIREKGVSILLEAFEMLQNKYPETSLKILGDGPEMGLLKRQVLEKKLEKRVEFFGVVSSDFIKNLYKIKPVFVNPSFYAEGFQIALLEAVASGLPIITTSVGGAGELLEANRSALFVVSRDKKSLFYAMEEYLLFPQKADTYSSVASRKVKEYFSQEKMVEKFYRYVFS
jgi:glycosyltransferase involved in cell wall biosynthesis